MLTDAEMLRYSRHLLLEDVGELGQKDLKNGKVLIIPAGSLNGNPDIAPQDNLFWPERAGWYDEALAAVHFDAFPE